MTAEIFGVIVALIGLAASSFVGFFAYKEGYRRGDLHAQKTARDAIAWGFDHTMKESGLKQGFVLAAARLRIEFLLNFGRKLEDPPPFPAFIDPPDPPPPEPPRDDPRELRIVHPED